MASVKPRWGRLEAGFSEVEDKAVEVVPSNFLIGDKIC
jgi:hypothetical protein